MNNSRTIKHLCAAELIEKFSYFGILSILILKMHTVLALSNTQTITSLGLFLTFTFAILVIAGYLSDTIISNSISLTYGGIILVVSNLLLATNSHFTFLCGMAMYCTGSALFKVNLTKLVGELSADTSRSKNYTWLYSCTNIGSMISPVIYGFIIYHHNWWLPFILSACLISAITIILHFDRITLTSKLIKNNIAQASIWILATISLVFLSFYFLQLGSIITFLGLLSIIIYWINIFRAEPTHSRRRLMKLFAAFILSALFFCCSFQVAGSLTLFIQHSIQAHISQLNISTPTFTALDPLFVVVFAPLFLWLWKKFKHNNKPISIYNKIGVGLLLATASFYTYSFTANHLNFQVTMLISLLVLGYLLIGAGEISFSPDLLTQISENAPKQLKTTTMGTWYLSIAIAGYISSKLFLFISNGGQPTAHAFTWIACFAFISALFAFFVAKLLKPQ